MQSLEVALWAFHRSPDIREGCLLAVNRGNDADTTDAIYGQIARAYYGVDVIPAPWRDSLAQADLVDRFAAKLFDHAQEGKESPGSPCV